MTILRTETLKVIYTLSIGFQYFLFCPCWWERRLTEFDRTVSDKIPGLTDWHLGTDVCSLNILNKSDKHFLPFHDLFHGLEAHIHLDFHLEKGIFIITFTPGKIKEFYDEQLKEQNELKQFFFLIYLKLCFVQHSRSLSNNEITRLPGNVFAALRNLGSL